MLFYMCWPQTFHCWSASTQVNSGVFLTRIFFCCTVSMLWYLLIQQSCPLYVFSGRNPQLQKFQMQGRKVSQHMHYDSPSKYCSYRSLSCLDHLIILNPFTAISKNPYSFHLIFEEYMALKFTGRHRITETFLWYHQRSSRPSSHSNGDYYQHYSRTALVLIHHSLEIWKYEDSSLSEQIVPILLHSS